MATTMEASASHSLIQSESHVHKTYTETSETKLKKKKSSRRHKDEGTISVSKSSSKLSKKMKAVADGNDNPQCEKCARPVYAMERIKAEKRTWHKDCFRCVQCNKPLTVETYQSEHTALYCKQHFKQLFEPKPVEDEADGAPLKKHQMIICESNPVELPPDVVRASDKPDLGLEELSTLDVKSRFEVFENKKRDVTPPPEARAPREKSAKLLSKLAKFKAKGMDVGVSDEYLNGVPAASSSEPEDEDDDDAVLKNSYAHSVAREQPVSFGNMSEIVGKFEAGANDERHRSRKQEIQNIRSRLFMGKQAKIKEMYEQSVMQSEQSITSAEKIAKELDLDSEKARAIKQRFESGEVFNDENMPPKNRDLDEGVFNEGIAKKSRSIFLELDANAKSTAPLSPPAHDPPKRKEIPFIPKDVVRAADKVEDVHIETSDISDRFRFFETYKPDTERREFRMTPPRQIQRPKSPSPEVYRDPTIVRSDSSVGDARLAAERATASRMIDVFRTLETREHDQPQGPKPLKCFTPPPPGAYTRDSSEYSSSGEEEEEEEDSEEERRREIMMSRESDEALKQAQQLARTKSFRDRFENWRDNEPQRSPSNIVIERGAGGGGQEEEEDGESQLETAKSLRAKFESLNVQSSSVAKTAQTRVHRFV